jgi:hypothetical protein
MDTDTIDPRAVKIMSDILALTIDEQDGVALSALSRIRRRARESAVTGGGLKETFRRLFHISGMVSSEELDHASSFGGRGAAPAMVGRLTSQVDALRSQLVYAEQLRLQDAADFVRRRRRDVLGGVGYGVMIGAATIVLAGVAVWAAFPRSGIRRTGWKQRSIFVQRCPRRFRFRSTPRMPPVVVTRGWLPSPCRSVRRGM